MSSYVFIKVLTGEFEKMFTNRDAMWAIQKMFPDGVDFILSGTLLPFRPVTWKSTTEITKENYLGSPVAGLQVCGSKEDDLVFNGSWKDRRLGAGMAEKMYDLFDGLRMNANLLQVQYKKNVRECILSELDKTYDKRVNEVVYRMLFKVRGRGERIKTTFDKFIDPIGNMSTAMANIINQLDLIANMPANMSRDVVDNVNSLVNNASSAIIRTRNTIENYVTLVADGINVMHNVMSTAKQLIGFFTTFDAIFNQVQSSAVMMLSSIPAEHAAFKRYILMAAGASASAKVSADEMHRSAKAYISEGSSTDKVVRVRDNQSMFDIAREHYGSVFRAKALLQYNNLIDMLPATGTLVKIPVRLPE